MIVETFYNILISLVKGLFTIAKQFIPGINITIYMAEFIAKILSVCQQAGNFCYFMLGDFMYVLLSLTLPLIIVKYTIFPVVQFCRSIFVNSNN